MSVDPAETAAATPRGALRSTVIVAISVIVASAAIVLLYVFSFLAIFFWFGERVPIAPGITFYVFSRSTERLDVGRILFRRDWPAGLDRSWRNRLEKVYFLPWFLSLRWEAGTASGEEEAMVRARLDDLRIPTGEGILSVDAEHVEAICRAGSFDLHDLHTMRTPVTPTHGPGGSAPP